MSLSKVVWPSAGPRALFSKTGVNSGYVHQRKEYTVNKEPSVKEPESESESASESNLESPSETDREPESSENALALRLNEINERYQRLELQLQSLDVSSSKHQTNKRRVSVQNTKSDEATSEKKPNIKKTRRRKRNRKSRGK